MAHCFEGKLLDICMVGKLGWAGWESFPLKDLQSFSVEPV